MVNHLSSTVSLLYSDLMQKVVDSELSLLSTQGSFVVKKIAGKRYWYHQSKQFSGQRNQVCIGPETPNLLDQIERTKELKQDISEIIHERKRLVALLSVAGASLEKGRAAKLIERMASVGLFRNGGMLVGSYAFSHYGNMLGVSFESDLRRTEDMDFSMDRKIEIGMSRNLDLDIKDVDSTFKFPLQINPSSPPFEMIVSDGFKVEFLTEKQQDVSDNTPVLIERFGVHAQPLDYLDYLIENVQSAVMLHGVGTLVKLPDPARFAFHKLAVSQLRPAALKTKADKDLQQALSLFEVLLEDSPGLLLLAAEAITNRRDLFAQFVLQGAKQLPDTIRGEIERMVPNS